MYAAYLVSGLAESLEINLCVHVVLLQLQQGSLMLIVHDPPAVCQQLIISTGIVISMTMK